MEGRPFPGELSWVKFESPFAGIETFPSRISLSSCKIVC
jgi:hypothetical protein